MTSWADGHVTSWDDDRVTSWANVRVTKYFFIFRKIFGFSKYGFRYLLDILGPRIIHSEKNNPVFLTPVLKLCIFIDFLRTNSYHRVIGTQMHVRVRQSTVCRVVNEISRVVASFSHEYVKMPNEEEANEIAAHFLNKTGLPFVQGVVDGTHFRVKKPSTKKNPPPERFFNRKSFYSINAMMICDHKKRIRHFTSRHVGSAHDSRIFNESFVKAKLEENFDKNNPRVLIGDEGYPCTNILLTPIRSDRVSTRKEKKFNKALKKARIIIEHTFGILKKRFPALLYQLRCTKIENCQAIIAAAVVLHNIFILIREDPPSLPPKLTQKEFNALLRKMQIPNANFEHPNNGNFNLRNFVIENYFN